MQTRRSSKAAAAAPASPPARPGVRRNPPRATRQQENQDDGRDSSSDLGPALTSASTILQKGFPPTPHPSGVGPPSTPPVAPSASVPPPNASPSLPSVQLPKGLTSVPRKGSLVFDPVPRRGAPRRASHSSIRISPERDSDDEPSIAQPPKSAAELLTEEMVSREIEEAEHQLKIEAVDSLARDARNVIGQLQNKSRPSYKTVLSLKMQAFEASRRVFLAHGQAFPFIQYEWLKKTRLKISESTRATALLAIKLANIATALGHIERIESEGESLKPFLDAIDTNFPRLFAAEENKEYLSLSLEIRTQRAIERIARSADGWLMDRFQSISHLMAKIKQEEVAKEEMRLLEQLRREERRALEEERRAHEEERRAKEEELRAREEALARKQRRQQDQEQERILRERQASQESAREGARRQQQAALPGSYPSPNAADKDSWAFQQGARESSPESISSSQPEPTPRRTSNNSRSLFSARDMVSMLNASSLQEQSTSKSSRKRSTRSDPQEVESDDGFEVDPRPHKKGKTATSSTTVRRRPSEQRRSDSNDSYHDDNDTTSSAPVQPPRESQTRESPPAAAAAAPTPSAPDYAALQHAKEVNRMTARLDKPRPHQTRHPWSERDSNTLIALIAKRAASWADIDRFDNAKFEHLRNAQAYRDKARNLKVDFLISDAPLPRGFDQVALSRKEIEKVVNTGKNPYRRERDIDDRGRPTNTAYVP
ncbi:hypothetical protein BBK36DRAFT_1108703 [Trichoderma citrinoviride]|uniref:Myb-like domain-containing protein n=1 Tax=Trichoderma citrinoviride TaxID=58853 RepID=A0A2T4BMK5_9HYPO|nr:hypothetical protein BBK36DRAFT_1108703 [Trichoderma citrinoviride]PTB70520.1 hypothetical protein BBK36DRAFT_1108703 [Trichoderma citrinoviride]